jgi:adenine-specific DNA-methyltransferase
MADMTRRDAPASPNLNAPIRYMGTKRAIASLVREQVRELRPGGLVADLFSGLGTVAAALAPVSSVVTNDALSFTGAVARARFLDRAHHHPTSVAKALFRDFDRCHRALRSRHAERLEAERGALSGGWAAVRNWMDQAPHVGNDESVRAAATRAMTHAGPDRYELATLYFSAGYFSTPQAIALDALRYAIDHQSQFDRDWLLAAWLSSADRLANAPGHTAQFLRPRSDETLVRLTRQWQRSGWAEFLVALQRVELIGDRSWRTGNRVLTGDALDAVRTDVFDAVRLVYADPPYTKDHYSRYYHVYETLYRYDFPDSLGQGRYRSDRVPSQFSILSTAERAFDGLFAAIASRRIPLILSYPDNGLVTQRVDVVKLLEAHFSVERILEVPLAHSTLGSSTGHMTKAARERIYVCRS